MRKSAITKLLGLVALVKSLGSFRKVLSNYKLKRFQNLNLLVVSVV